jgi:hypothetical protein
MDPDYRRRHHRSDRQREARLHEGRQRRLENTPRSQRTGNHAAGTRRCLHDIRSFTRPLVDAACRRSAIEAAIIITPPNSRPCFSTKGWRDQDHRNKSKQPSFRTDDADPGGEPNARPQCVEIGIPLSRHQNSFPAAPVRRHKDSGRRSEHMASTPS